MKEPRTPFELLSPLYQCRMKGAGFGLLRELYKGLRSRESRTDSTGLDRLLGFGDAESRVISQVAILI